ncbi:hypothetical protein L218DRAFT_949802 [Marasmius fiardii PR-910]|nr:hypothetical protein L218DRAFT_949802 [Marasmius fiardii PR-910]
MFSAKFIGLIVSIMMTSTAVVAGPAPVTGGSIVPQIRSMDSAAKDDSKTALATGVASKMGLAERMAARVAPRGFVLLGRSEGVLVTNLIYWELPQAYQYFS